MNTTTTPSAIADDHLIGRPRRNPWLRSTLPLHRLQPLLLYLLDLRVLLRGLNLAESLGFHPLLCKLLGRLLSCLGVTTFLECQYGLADHLPGQRKKERKKCDGLERKQ